MCYNIFRNQGKATRRLNRAERTQAMKTYTYRQLGEKMEQMGRSLICVAIAHIMRAGLAEPGKAPDLDDIAPDDVVKFCLGAAADE